MTPELAASFRYCQRVARSTARNFYYSFLALPRDQRKAMCALYAFLRATDDLGDSPAPADKRMQALAEWRQKLNAALEGRTDDLLFPALANIVARYAIPVEYLHAVIDGMEMDLEVTRYQTFADLELYCYRVASVVGLCCIHIWGFEGEEAIEPARRCGIAFQLTNILRDLKEDAERGRVYLPLEDLEKFEYTVEDLMAGVRDERFRRLMDFEIERTEQFYQQGILLNRWLAPAGRPAFGAMVAIYHGLLTEIKRRDGDVFDTRVSLSGWKKLRIAAGSLFGLTPRDVGQLEAAGLEATRG